jgi:hypothetical protein
MKRILLILFICSGFLAKAQTYNNEWIDYSKTYFKFKIGSDGLYRISQSTLNSLGLGSTPAQDLQLWRNGQEITLYTSVASGALGASDYIEFWGHMNDGKPDNQLYRDPNLQLNDHWSLQTDTSFYFLTVNSSTANKRYTVATNNVAGNTLPAEPYFIHTMGTYFKDRINSGFATIVVDVYVYSSAYDEGEGWTSYDIGGGATLPVTHNNLYVYSGGPSPSFSINAAGNALNQRMFKVNINGTQVIEQTMDFFNDIKAQTTFSLSLLNSAATTVDIVNECVPANDRMVVAQYEIKYPRQFNFDNQKNFSFELPANINGNYLEITNFNYGSTAPVLYDITNNNRYVADISDPTKCKFALLPSSVNRKLILVNEEASNITAVTSFQTRNFINYGLAANQGDYIIISNPLLYSGAGGSNPVDDYKTYRSSAAGGSYNAKIYDVNQLVDQFGFGIKKHPSSVKNFLQYAYNNYTSTPKSVFLIGKGVNYAAYRVNENSSDPVVQSDLEKLNLVPTFGSPASDNLLTCYDGNNIPTIPVGRLSAINADEVALYLKKVKDYELAQAFASCASVDKAWMKNVVHVIGASEPLLTILRLLMDKYGGTISDTLYGGYVSSFYKASNDIEQLTSEQLRQLFEQGISLITYFGHSSASTLEFNLDDPMSYNNQGKYPVFITLGCNAGNIYNFNQNRFVTKETVSENFVFAPDRGSIAFIATTSLGIVQYLDILNTENYKAISVTKYGSPLGDIMKEAIARTFDNTTQFDFYARVHCEQISINGDPALKYNTFAKPDYVIEPEMVKITPAFVSVAETSFRVNAQILNIGRATNKNIVIEVKRTYPDGTTEVVRRDTIPGIRFMDSIILNLPIVATRDKGLNKITITVDADDDVQESCEGNNVASKDIFIYEDEARPVYPYNYAIINKQNIKLVASTANPFAASKLYTMEMDTTEFFNSPFKITKTLTSTGGVLEFTPGITFTDSTVYYWRVSQTPASGQPKWNNASFVYLASSDPGFNQSHFYQHTKSLNQKITYDSVSRKWYYDSVLNNLYIRSGVFPTSFNQAAAFSVTVNDVNFIRSVCGVGKIVFNTFDERSFKAWFNSPGPATPGRYGSDDVCFSDRAWNFQYNLKDSSSRGRAVAFMDTIPDGDFVVVRNCSGTTLSSTTYAADWKNDTTFLGPGNSLYHRLLGQGFTTIDSFYKPRAWIFVYQKNRPSFTPRFIFSDDIYDPITLSVNCRTLDSVGYMTSPVFGPAKAWKQLKWRGNTEDVAAGDAPTVDVIGVDQNGNESTLYSGVDLSSQDFDISAINTSAYPYVKLKMRNIDSIYFTPYQMRYWRLTDVPAPEGAIAPNIFFQMKDTVDVGEPLDFRVCFKNISDVPFDSLKVKMIITDKNNVQNIIPVPRQRPLIAGDTLTVRIPVDTRHLPGNNTLFVNVNPDFDQPEQYLFNNFGFRNLYVKPDSLNPIMDVTFDGVHILNRDIVSSKPHILIKLKDEAKWMVLTDTSLLTVKVRYPNGSLRRFYFSNDTLKFTPAGPAPNTDNTAAIDFLPYFEEDGDYELIVSGKDMSNNQAGTIEYRVGFQVINTPMISNMLNYPNPFTTSTAFVFTLTGSDVPQNIKIEIMTITGKIVREITKDELGPLHIGRNITEFKWDGTDQYGQKLANGIYLYRVVTNLNGKKLDKFRGEGDDTDKYFNKGYGKMYLMR